MRYYLSKICGDDDRHLIHTVTCRHLPREQDERIYLGDFPHCGNAIDIAKLYFLQLHCCPECTFRC